ncbi:hypothetical protein [Helicobacter marmotae]|nr:hypothetical protein [Helicobacter marmotae]
MILVEILRLKAQNDKLTTLPHRRETKITQNRLKDKPLPLKNL